MGARECGETHARIRQSVGGMSIVRPLNERRNEAVAWQMSVLGNRDAPMERTTLYRLRWSDLDGTRAARGFDVVGARDPVNQFRLPSQRVAHRRRVEREPARPRGNDAVRIDRDHFEE